MVIIALASALSGVVQGPPDDQRFNFSARLNLEKGSVRIGINRATDLGLHGRGKKPSPYRWSVVPGSTSLKLVPLTTAAAPKIVGMPSAFPAMQSSDGIRGDLYEGLYNDGKVDWSGCRAGLYRLIAKLTVQGENRRWDMSSDHLICYWSPDGKPSDLRKVGQRFLKVDPDQRSLPAPLGSTFTLKKFAPHQGSNFLSTFTLREDATGKTTSQGPMHDDLYRLGLQAVRKDPVASDLTRRFQGKTMYAMGSYLPILKERSSSSIDQITKGTPVVIREIWRGGQSQSVPFTPETLGENQYRASECFPLYVVFEAEAKELFPYEKGTAGRRKFIATMVDGWAFERLFSSTSMTQDFKGWKPRPDGLPKPTWPEVGMTPKQVAWLRGWPTAMAPAKEVLKSSTWTYTSERKPQTKFTFKNQRLLPGEGVITR